MASCIQPPEAAILQRLVDPQRCGWSEQAAQAVLTLNFPAEDQERAAALADLANQGILTHDEEREMESYLRLGNAGGLGAVEGPSLSARTQACSMMTEGRDFG